MEVAPGVRWLTMPMGGGSLNHINLYLLEDDAGWWVVDTGLSLEETRDYWHQIFDNELGGKPVIGVILGEDSGRQRDAHMVELMSAYLPESGVN